MNKYLIICLLSLTACESPKPKTYACMSALGGVMLPDSNPDVEVSKGYVRLNQDDKVIYFPKSLCITVEEK